MPLPACNRRDGSGGDEHADQDAATPAHHPVVVVGAGPVGLTLAIDLAQRGVPVVLLDDDGAPMPTGTAGEIWSRGPDLCLGYTDPALTADAFDRDCWYRSGDMGVLDADGLEERLAATSEHLNPEFGVLFDEMLRRRVDRLAVEPEDLEALVEAITIYHMVLEGMLALTGQHFIIDYNERMGTLPGFVDGFTKVARDEHRHVAFGAGFLREMARRDPRYGEAIQRAPNDWQLWFVRARLEVKSGDVDGARRALARARRLNPRAPFFSQ